MSVICLCLLSACVCLYAIKVVVVVAVLVADNVGDFTRVPAASAIAPAAIAKHQLVNKTLLLHIPASPRMTCYVTSFIHYVCMVADWAADSYMFLIHFKITATYFIYQVLSMIYEAIFF